MALLLIWRTEKCLFTGRPRCTCASIRKNQQINIFISQHFVFWKRTITKGLKHEYKINILVYVAS